MSKNINNRSYYSNLDDVVAVILAGGEGTRFRPYTEIIPKPMIPIGSEEKPILEHIICWLRRFGVKEFVLLVGYRWKQIRNYFGDGSRHGVRIVYSVDEAPYTGTGGALLKACKNGLINRETAVIWYGDIIAAVDVKKLIDFHRESGADATIVVADKYKVPVGIAKLDKDNNVVELTEKPWLNIYVTIGVLAIEKKALENVEKELGTSFDIMADLIPWMIRKGFRVKAFIYQGLWYDVGSLERYVKIDYDSIKEFLCEDENT